MEFDLETEFGDFDANKEEVIKKIILIKKENVKKRDYFKRITK